MTAASDMHCLPAQGKIESDRGARAGVALDANLARMFLDDAVGDGKPKPRATGLAFFRDGLGREERIVYPLNVLRRNARPGVAYAHADHFTIGSRHGELSTACHRVFRVKKEIQEYLL